MLKKYIIATTCIQAICLFVILWTLTVSDVTSVEAHVSFQEPTATPPTPTPVPPLLGPIYYGEEYVWKVFDHQLPLDYAPIPLEPGVRHYDYSFHNPPTSEYGYDGHIGIDYSLEYEPVLASANGVVDVADWSNPANHRLGYGLHVVMSFDANADYTAIYGHLSTLNVETGDEIEIDPNDPSNRDRIIGISGNTGHVFNNAGDCAPIPVSGPDCGQHLHFETRRNGVVVNPYGWISSTPDPWALHEDGTVSHYLWENQPAVLSTQYVDSGPPGTKVDEPTVNNARMIIDDTSADFTHGMSQIDGNGVSLPPPSCGTFVDNEGAYNLSYQQMSANIIPVCPSYWYVSPDVFTPPGAYDVFVRIPAGENKTLGAEYTILHNGQVSTAVVVQGAYPNDPDDPDYILGVWVYIGRYDFAMQSDLLEYIKLSNQTTLSSEVGTNTNVVADAVMLAPAEATPPPVEEIYVSFANDGMVGNIAYADEDILVFNTNTGDWALLFDGSDVGLAARNVDDFDFQDANIYFSLNQPQLIGFVPQFYRFSPTSLGSDTTGTTTAVFTHGELQTAAEDVDAFSFGSDVNYLFSTVGTAVTSAGSFDDEDVFAYTSHKTFTSYWDGTSANLTNETEDVNGLWLDPATDELYLTTVGLFDTLGSRGDGGDIFSCKRKTEDGAATCDPGLFWNGSAHGLGWAQLDGLSLTPCSRFGNGSFEQQFRCWTILDLSEERVRWSPTNIEAYSGQFSAQAALYGPQGGESKLISSPFTIASKRRYNFAFYAKSVPSNAGVLMLYANIIWYKDGQRLNPPLEVAFITSVLEDWTPFSADYICPPPGADAARWEFHYIYHTLQAHNDLLNQGPSHLLFIDDVSYHTPDGVCPMP